LGTNRILSEKTNIMKKLLIIPALFLAFLFTWGDLFAQAPPQAVNYQAVARDGGGNLMVNQAIDVRFSIRQTSATGTDVYVETQATTTNEYGLFTLELGKGTALTGTFDAIDWGLDDHFLKVEVDKGAGFVDMGASQILSVPYSLRARFANKSTNMLIEDLKNVEIPGALTTGDILKWNGTDFVPAVDAGNSYWDLNGSALSYAGGYVGIGTTTPGAGVEVKSSAGYGSAIGLYNTGGGTNWRITSWTDGTLRFVKVPGTTFSAIAIEPMNGKVGIGTGTPDEQLSVHTSSSVSYIRVSDNTTGPTSGLRLGLNGAGNAYIINDEAAKSLNLGTSGTTQMRISDNGHVSINTTADDMMFLVRQDIANRGLRIQHQSTTDYWDNGVGTTTKNYKFYYNGLFRADISSTDGAYVQSSDRRLKRDIQEMGPVLAKVAQLKPSTYHYIDNAQSAPRSTGFVAQDVESLFPDLVRDTDDGYKGLVYDGFAVISIKAIQELNEKMEAMQLEIDQLKAALGK
jgi:hypothetical protein